MPGVCIESASHNRVVESSLSHLVTSPIVLRSKSLADHFCAGGGEEKRERERRWWIVVCGSQHMASTQYNVWGFMWPGVARLTPTDIQTVPQLDRHKGGLTKLPIWLLHVRLTKSIVFPFDTRTNGRNFHPLVGGEEWVIGRTIS